MPVRRNTEGIPIETPTTAFDAPKSQDVPKSQDEQPTEVNPSAQPSPDFLNEQSDDPLESSTTVLKDQPNQLNQPSPPNPPPNSPKVGVGQGKHTAVYRPGQPSAVSGLPSSERPPTPTHTMTDPPVGWLVIVSGPGQGNVATIRHGRNSVGRSSEDRISLNYGDEMISRYSHAVVIYDPEGKKFYIQQGQGTNLIYINDAPVLEATMLAPLTHIRIGRTVLRFVPLCGEEFDWTDEED